MMLSSSPSSEQQKQSGPTPCTNAGDPEEEHYQESTRRTSRMLQPTVADVLACQFSSWYPVFSNLPTTFTGGHENKRRSNVTIKSVILSDLPDEFVTYLDTDRLILPAHTKTSSILLEQAAANNNDEDDDEWSNSDNEEDDDSDLFDFPQLNRDIEQAIAALGGTVVPKLNWSSPKDAVWVNSGSMACQTAGDVYLLLKASDFCSSFDVHHALTDDVVVVVCDDAQEQKLPAKLQLQLALRKYCPGLNPSQEFRCFVGGGDNKNKRRLLAISQRHASQHFAHLRNDKNAIQARIQDFFDTVVAPHFCSERFVFDVYVDRRDRVWLVDFNVWGRRTDALLFTWSELQHYDDSKDDDKVVVVFRVVETAKQVRADPLSSYKAPIDTLHMAGGGTFNEGDAKFKEFMKQCQRPSAITSDSSDDDSSGGTGSDDDST